MISAVDSSVLLDIITSDTMFGVSSERALLKARREGSLIICECVAAELVPALGNERLVREFLSDLSIEYVPACLDCALEAGMLYRTYLVRGGPAKRVVPDFLVGAHARHHADRLLARDRGYLRDYLRKLTVMDPSTL